MDAHEDLRAELDEFVRVTHSACEARLRGCAADPALAGLLLAALDQHRAHRVGPAAHPAALVLLVARSEGQVRCDMLLEAAVGFTLDYVALGLLDAVHDDELSGPLAAAGAAQASNGALAIYTLALDALHAAAEARPALERRALRRTLRRSAMRQAAGQHDDLRRARPRDLRAAAESVAAKASLLALVAEYTARLCGAGPTRAARYAALGRASCLMRQAVNDVRDIYGKPVSDDLAAGRASLPVACLRAVADPETLARFEALRLALPASMDALRGLLVAAGALAALAREMERARREVHAEARALGLPGGPFDLYLEFVDAMADQVYRRSPPHSPAPAPGATCS